MTKQDSTREQCGGAVCVSKDMEAGTVTEKKTSIAEESRTETTEVRNVKSVLTNSATRRPQMQTSEWPEWRRAFLASAALNGSAGVCPVSPSGTWQIGACSVKGNVRKRNEDSVIAFAYGDIQVVLVADGVAATRYGREAAALAVFSGGMRIVRQLRCSSGWHGPDLEETVRAAIWAAHHQLTIEADKLDIRDINGGLRTTLIVVIARGENVHYGYIGDGGGLIVRTSGEVERFLVPQKAEDAPPNVLAASLGPLMEGTPVVGSLRRHNGDLILIGTDGIFDRLPDGFAKDVLRGCIEAGGNLQGIAEQVCAEMAEQRDGRGYICDDNMTLGLIGTHTPPVLAPGFWADTERSSAPASPANGEM